MMDPLSQQLVLLYTLAAGRALLKAVPACPALRKSRSCSLQMHNCKMVRSCAAQLSASHCSGHSLPLAMHAQL